MHMPSTDSANNWEHFWIELEFSSGETITVRVDEKSFYNPRVSSVFLRRNDKFGFYATV